MNKVAEEVLSWLEQRVAFLFPTCCYNPSVRLRLKTEGGKLLKSSGGKQKKIWLQADSYGLENNQAPITLLLDGYGVSNWVLSKESS